MTQLRELTPAGVELARQFLAQVREGSVDYRAVPDELLYASACSVEFPVAIDFERQPFETRRDAAEYLAPRLEPVRHLVSDNPGVWSWLGMYYFPAIVPVSDGRAKLSPRDETFVIPIDDADAFRTRRRNYLWISWRIYVAHGEAAAFLLNEPVTSFRRLANRVLANARIFNSVAVVQLVLHLYTRNGLIRGGFAEGRGSLEHLIYVIDQLERTYDVYGMELDALLAILPPDFDRWRDDVSPGQVEVGKSGDGDDGGVRGMIPRLRERFGRSSR